MKKHIEIPAGSQFGHLTVIEKTDERAGNEILYLAACECGANKLVPAGGLRRGKTKSCGCMQHAPKHGMSRSDEYSIRHGMIRRCHAPGSPGYAEYGGRGIAVCDEWRASFDAFFADMGPRPSRLHSIDRINPDLGYFKENCRWALPTTQARNKRKEPSKTGVKGVHPMPNGVTFKANITVNDRTIHIGVFGSIEEATKARKEAESKYWGEEQ